MSRPWLPRAVYEATIEAAKWQRSGNLFDHLAAKNNDPALAFMPLFRTHPPSAERKEQVAAVFGELQGTRPRSELYLGRRNLARRLTKEQKRLDE